METLKNKLKVACLKRYIDIVRTEITYLDFVMNAVAKSAGYYRVHDSQSELLARLKSLYSDVDILTQNDAYNGILNDYVNLLKQSIGTLDKVFGVWDIDVREYMRKDNVYDKDICFEVFDSLRKCGNAVFELDIEVQDMTRNVG